MSKDKPQSSAILLGGSVPFRHAYSGQMKSQICFLARGRTKQEFRDECDINRIMSQYQKTGALDFVTRHQPQYLDVHGIDYQEAMNVVAQSRSMFAELPSTVRNRFDNNPGLFLDFMHDPENYAEAKELGLLRPGATIPSPTPPPNPAPPPVPANTAPDPKTTTPEAPK